MVIANGILMPHCIKLYIKSFSCIRITGNCLIVRKEIPNKQNAKIMHKTLEFGIILTFLICTETIIPVKKEKACSASILGNKNKINMHDVRYKNIRCLYKKRVSR